VTLSGNATVDTVRLSLDGEASMEPLPSEGERDSPRWNDKHGVEQITGGGW